MELTKSKNKKKNNLRNEGKTKYVSIFKSARQERLFARSARIAYFQVNKITK